MIYQPVDSNYLIKTYGEVFAEVQALIAHLKGLDLGPGSKVGLLSENRYEWLVAYCAASASGLVVVPLDPRLSPLEWTTILNHAEASLLFFSENFSAQALELSVTVPSLRRRIGWGPSIVNNDVQDSLSEIVKAGAADTVGPLPNSSGDSIASLIYTSGTTGIPKGVLLSQSNILHNAARMRRRGDRPGKMTLMILPLNHIYGFIGFLANVLYGQSVILFSKIDVRVILKTLQDLRPQHVAGVPAFYENIGKTIRKQLAEKLPKSLVPYLKGPAYRALGREPTSLRSLKKILFKKVHDTFGGRIEYLSSGGAPLEPRLARLFNLLGLPILEGYGLTETTSVVSANDLGSAHYRLGSVGKVCADSEVMVLNPDPSGVGEICVKGPAVMQGYYKNVEDTAAVFETEGWFKTGDLGCLDSDGFLFVTGRSKDVIVTPNGKKIFPDEVQSRLGDLPFVKEFVNSWGAKRSPRRRPPPRKRRWKGLSHRRY
ncbi:MAG: AMP-binding protein [Deltaproteobacteria bacterium]|nr:AMP-binding protein [Deltaproteobacteria bacterium]